MRCIIKFLACLGSKKVVFLEDGWEDDTAIKGSGGLIATTDLSRSIFLPPWTDSRKYKYSCHWLGRTGNEKFKQQSPTAKVLSNVGGCLLWFSHFKNEPYGRKSNLHLLLLYVVLHAHIRRLSRI